MTTTSKSRNVKNIERENKLYIAADKTTNFYRMDTTTYNQLMDTNVTYCTKSYSKSDKSTTASIMNMEKKIATNLDLADRIDCIAQKDSFLTLKDHKPNFKNNPKCRLINPSKSDIGVVRKQILERINKKVVTATKVNQ